MKYTQGKATQMKFTHPNEVHTGESNSNSNEVDTAEIGSNQDEEGNSNQIKVVAGGAVGAIGTAAVAAPVAVAAGVPVLAAAGFTTGGVAAGSVAATVQSFIGSVAAGTCSLFATLQSVGATAILGTVGCCWTRGSWSSRRCVDWWNSWSLGNCCSHQICQKAEVKGYEEQFS